jgi:hypothetical protein
MLLMDNPIISDVRTTAYKEGIAEGIEIARQMLCKSLGKNLESYGQAVAHVDKLIWEKERHEKAAFDE